MPQPNILFLLPDQHRGDWLGGNRELPLRTPTLDALQRRGISFNRAYTPSPLCAPARACLAAGRDYAGCQVPDNRTDYPLSLPTYYQGLRAAGYRVGGVGKFDLHKDTSDPTKLSWGLDGSRCLEEWGFTDGIDNEGKLDGSNSYRGAGGQPRGPYLKFLAERGLADTYVREHAEAGQHRRAYVTALPDDAYCDNWLSENGLEVLRRVPTGQPWHLVVNFTGPHEPMDVTQRMHELWCNTPFPPPHANTQPRYTAADHQRNRQYYAAMIENIDRQAGRFIELVQQRGELDRTLIVYSSDHGEMLGDHGRWGKGTWREPSIRIPMIIAGPGIRAGVTSDALVCLHDLCATFLDAAGAAPLAQMEARSLMPLLRGERVEHRSHALSALRNWRSITDGRYKLVWQGDAESLLFDLQTDPWEDRNLAGEPGHAACVAGLLATLEAAGRT